MEPTHPHGRVENATAPSAGGSPDGDGEVNLGNRLPFRTNYTYWSSCPLYSPVSVLRKATIWSRSASVYGVVNW